MTFAIDRYFKLQLCSISEDFDKCIDEKLSLKQLQYGQTTLTIVTGHDEIHQSVTLPRIHCDEKDSREIFGVWTPIFDRSRMFTPELISTEYLTDS